MAGPEGQGRIRIHPGGRGSGLGSPQRQHSNVIRQIASPRARGQDVHDPLSAGGAPRCQRQRNILRSQVRAQVEKAVGEDNQSVAGIEDDLAGQQCVVGEREGTGGRGIDVERGGEGWLLSELAFQVIFRGL